MKGLAELSRIVIPLLFVTSAFAVGQTASTGAKTATAGAHSPTNAPITIFLCGDVMTGRGIDQILPFPSAPALHEPYIQNAKDYVRLAEKENGPIPKPVSFSYIWGDAPKNLSG
jgi:poly-gamma-glutamate synthesis protein (capsule biosynthesis protein)